MIARPLLPVALLTLLAGLLATAASADEVWREPFAASPEQLIEACVDHAPEEAEFAWYLRLAHTVSYDAEGRRTRTSHEIYRVDDAGVADDWDRVKVDWAPGYQDRPEIRARVVNPDGSEAWLDLGTASEQAVGSNLADVLSDRMSLVAPLPFVRSGSIVEVRTELRDRDPFFTGGLAERHLVARHVTVADREIACRVHRDLPFRWMYLRGDGPDPDEDEDGSWRVYRFRFGALEPADWMDLLSDYEDEGALMLGTSTAESWSAVARAYDAIVEEVLAQYEPDDAVRAIVEQGGSREELVTRLARHARSSIRYTGLHLGMAGLVPYRPAEVDQRGYGDCKDQSTYLVASLRAAGLEAHMATLLTAPDVPVTPELPGLGVFDHAIVHVPGEPAYWIDPTDREGPVFSLPAPVQRRRALVIDESTTGLVETPGTGASENTDREERVVTLADYGPGRVVERSYPVGIDAATYRSDYKLRGRSDYEESLRTYARAHYSAQGDIVVEHAGLDDPDAPLELVITVEDAAMAWTEEGDAVAFLPTWTAFSSIDHEGLDDGDPFEFYVPFAEILEYRVEHPASYELLDLPEAVDESFGPVSVRMDFEEADPVTVLVRVELRVDEATIPAGHAAAYAEWARTEPMVDSVDLYFVHRGSSLLQNGEYRAAREILRAEHEARPDAALPLVRLSHLYLQLGLVEAATGYAREARDADPELAMACRTLGACYSSDGLGRAGEPGFDLVAAREAFEKAVELDPDDTLALSSHAAVLSIGPDGQTGSEGSEPDLAYEQLLRLRELESSPETDQTALQLLMVSQRYAKLASFAELDGLAPGLEAAAQVLDCVVNREGEDLERTLNRIRTRTDVGTPLAFAAIYSLMARDYPAAAGIWSELARNSANIGQRRAAQQAADVLRHARRVEDILADEPDPRHAAIRFLRVLFERQWDDESLDAVFTGPRPDPEYAEIVIREGAGSMRAMAAQASFGVLTDMRPILDMTVAFMDWDATGTDGTGWRVMPGQGSGLEGASLFVVPTRDGYRVAGVNDFDGPGWYAVEALDDDRETDARVILAEARERITGVGESESGIGHAFARLYDRIDSAIAPTLEDCAYALGVGWPEASERLGELVESRPWRDDPELRRTAWTEILVGSVSYGDERHRDRAIEALLGIEDRGENIDRILAMQLAELGRVDDTRSVVGPWLESESPAHWARRVLADAYARAGRFDESMAEFERLVDSDETTVIDLNQHAWMAICGGVENEEHVRRLEEERIEEASVLHTMALLKACLGEIGPAREYAVQAMDLATPAADDANYLLLAARIADRLGDHEIARDLYRQILDDADRDEKQDPRSSVRLARVWLDELP